MEEDLRGIEGASTLQAAVTSLLEHVPATSPIEGDDFLRDYTDGKFWRFFLYLLVYRNQAQDWGTGTLLGFEGKELLADFRPQWHHIYPQKFLQKKVDPDRIDSLANIAVIGPSINIRISAQDPMKYLDKYKISDDQLGQQHILWRRSDFTIERYADFIDARAELLAKEANRYLLELSKSLPDHVRPITQAEAAAG